MDMNESCQGLASKIFEAGYTDLVSVIPPDAKICPRSNIRPSSLGKCPGLRRGDCWYGYDFLSAPIPSAEKVKAWDEWGANLGLLAKRFPAFDIDVDEELPAEVIEEFLLERLGPAPCRLSQFSRRLLPYRTDEPLSRRRLSFNYGGVDCAVEVLCRGRQYVIHGQHPSGENYRWRDKPLWDQAPNTLTSVTETQIDEVLDALSEKLRELPGVTDLRLKVDGERRDGGTPPPQESLRAPSYELLEKVVGTIRNDARFESREEYIKVGYAIKAAGGDRALPIFLGWCARWEDGYNDPATVEADWHGMNPPYRVGWGYLLRLSDRRWPELYFEIEPHPGTAPEEEVEVEGSDGLRRALEAASHLDCEWHCLPDRLRDFACTVSDLPLGEKVVAEAAAVRELTRERVRTGSGARRLLERYIRPNREGAFEPDAHGIPQLRLLTAAEANVEGRFLVDELIPAAGVGGLYADYGVGKTWLAIDVGLSIAFGRPWFGKPTVQKPVIFLVAEGNREFHVRVFAWLVEHGVLDKESTTEELFAALKGRVLINRYPVRFDDPDFQVGLTSTIEAVGAGLVVIDTLGKSLGADQSENDNDVANEILGMLSDIAARTDCSALLVHHVGYGASNRARGASAWEQGLNYSYRIDGTREDFSSGAPLRLTCQKMKDAPTPPPNSYKKKAVPDLRLTSQGTDGGEPISGLVVVPATGGALSREARVFEYVREQSGCTKGDVRDGVTGGNEDVDSTLASLLGKGAIVNTGVPNRHRYETVPMWDIDPRGNVINRAEVDLFEIEPAPEAS